MKYLLSISLLSFLLVISISSCKEKGCTDPNSISYESDAEEDNGSCEYGGLGGSVELVAKPEHHGDPILSGDSAGYNDSLFIKFNAIESPGSNPSNYDLVVVGDSGEDHVHLDGLKRGLYYIYMTGWDIVGNERVFGGIPIKIEQTSGEFVIKVPVSEP